MLTKLNRKLTLNEKTNEKRKILLPRRTNKVIKKIITINKFECFW